MHWNNVYRAILYMMPIEHESMIVFSYVNTLSMVKCHTYLSNVNYKSNDLHHSENGDLTRQSFASLSGENNYILTFLPGLDDSIIFPGKK